MWVGVRPWYLYSPILLDSQEAKETFVHGIFQQGVLLNPVTTFPTKSHWSTMQMEMQQLPGKTVIPQLW